MGRDEFLQRLRTELVNFVSESVIREQLDYYYNYIREECGKGRAESDVVAELGDARLIAKSIIDAAEAGGDRVAATTPFRYSEEEINYNTDEEDLGYEGAHQDSDTVYDPFQSFRERREQEEEYQSSAGQQSGTETVEDGRVEGNENPFRRTFHGRSYQMGGVGCLITAILLFMLLWILGAIIGGVFRLLSPILMPLLVVLVLLWFFKGIMDR